VRLSDGIRRGDLLLDILLILQYVWQCGLYLGIVCKLPANCLEILQWAVSCITGYPGLLGVSACGLTHLIACCCMISPANGQAVASGVESDAQSICEVLW